MVGKRQPDYALIAAINLSARLKWRTGSELGKSLVAWSALFGEFSEEVSDRFLTPSCANPRPRQTEKQLEEKQRKLAMRALDKRADLPRDLREKAREAIKDGTAIIYDELE